VLALIEQLRASGAVASHHGWLHLPEHKAGFTDEQAAAWQKAQPLFGDEAWWVRDLARETATDEQLMRAALRQAAQQGAIAAIVKDRYYRNERIVQFAQLIRRLDSERRISATASASAASWRSRSSSTLTASVLPAAGATITCCATRCSFPRLTRLSSDPARKSDSIAGEQFASWMYPY